MLLLAIGGVLAYVLYAQGLQVAAAWAELLSLVVAGVSFLTFRTGRPGHSVTSSTQRLEAVQKDLAAAVLRQWREEIRIRQLDDPAPLAVHWRFMEVGDRVLLPGLAQSGVLRFVFGGRDGHVSAGRSDQVGLLADRFRSLDRRRLVILGDPGMGKTTLAVLLVRELLRRQRPGDPVPVLFTVSDWRPADESWRDWLARRLSTEHPVLRTRADGFDDARLLVEDRRILPVLDGLDEMPEPVRQQALAAINAAIISDDTLIVTCRTAEYKSAVAAGGGINAAAVIEPEPLRGRDIAAYLTNCLGQRASRRGAWPHLIRIFTTNGINPLTEALTTPLDLWLVRKIFIEPGLDPAIMIDHGSLPTAAKISGHLFDHLTSSVINVAAQREPRTRQPARPRSQWKPDDAERWLAFLARHLNEMDSRDLAWWRLHRCIRIRWTHRTAVGIVTGLIFATLCAPVSWAVGLFAHQPTAALISGAVGGMVVGMAFGIGSDYTGEPAYADLRPLPGRVRLLLRQIAYRVTIVVSIGVAVGLASMIAGAPAGLLTRITVITLVFGVVYGFMVWVATPVPSDKVRTPAATLRADLSLALLRTLAFTLTGGLVTGFTAGLLGAITIPITFLITAAFLAALLIGSPPKVASSVYLASVFILAGRRLVPLRLVTFLDEAHRLGLLRQIGPVYQFRHARLQDHLARTSNPAERTENDGLPIWHSALTVEGHRQVDR